MVDFNTITPEDFIKPFQLTQIQRRAVYDAIRPTRPELSQKGKIVVVTGAGGAVGYRTVEAFSKAGAAGIVLAGRNEKQLQKATEVAGGVPTLVVATDITDPKAVENLFLKTKARFGKADVLAHIAGVSTIEALKDGNPDAWWNDIEINTRGTFNVAHYWLNVFGEQGTIISTTSLAAHIVSPGLSAYSISKWSQIRLAEALDLEHPSIRAFSLHPGIVPTEDGRGMLPEAFLRLALDHPDLAASLIVYLASDRADYLRGGFVNVNWDVEELEAHQEEFKEKQLGRLAFINAPVGAGPFAWTKQAV